MAEQATYLSVYDAGLVQLAQLGRKRRALAAEYQPTDAVEASILDLRFGLETIGKLADADQQLTVQAYVQENYGLFGLGLDPLDHAPLPPITGQGTQVQPLVLGIQGGKVVGIQGGKVLGIGARLVPATTPPSFDTTLAVDATAGAYTYNGVVGSTISFNIVSGSGALPASVNLYRNNQQVGHLDYPPEANGQPFGWTLAGVTYYGVLDTTVTRIDLA